MLNPKSTERYPVHLRMLIPVLLADGFTITFSPSIASLTMSVLGGSTMVSRNGTIGAETCMGTPAYLQQSASA